MWEPTGSSTRYGAFGKRFKKLGGRVLFRHRVTDILTEAGRLAGLLAARRLAGRNSLAAG